jgi:hypothetical protein
VVQLDYGLDRIPGNPRDHRLSNPRTITFTLSDDESNIRIFKHVIDAIISSIVARFEK